MPAFSIVRLDEKENTLKNFLKHIDIYEEIGYPRFSVVFLRVEVGGYFA